MKLLGLILVSLFLSGCSYGFLTPEVIAQLKDDKASVCFVAEGGPVALGSGILAFCRANSDGRSTLEVTPEGKLTIDHNITPPSPKP